MEEKHPTDSDRSETRRAGRRWSRRRLWAVRALTGIAAVLLLAAFGFGWVDAAVIALALVLLRRLVRRPERVHPATAIVLTAVTGVLLWANLRPAGWQALFEDGAPENPGPVAKALFWRGWPLCPFMLCPYHHMTYLPANAFVEQALIYDAAFFVAALLATRFVCQRVLRCPGKAAVPTLNQVRPAPTPLVSVLTTGFLAGVLFGLLDRTLLHVAWWRFDRHTGRAIIQVLDTLDAPAIWLRDWWVDALSPLTNHNLARSVIPMLTVVLQWGLVGLIGGIWWSHHLREEGVPVAAGSPRSSVVA